MKLLKINLLVAMLCIATNFYARAAEVDIVADYSNLPHYCNDFAGVLSDDEAEYLEQLLSAHADTSELKVKVLILPSLGELYTTDVAPELLKANGFRGALFLAKCDTKYHNYAATVATTEGEYDTLSPDVCDAIRNNFILPFFRNVDFATGVLSGAKALAYEASGYSVGASDYPLGDDSSSELLWFLMALLVVAYIYAKFRGRKDGPMTTGWLVKRTLIVLLKLLFFYIVIPVKILKFIYRIFVPKKKDVSASQNKKTTVKSDFSDFKQHNDFSEVEKK